jgi:ActR/RegA family two-component response regulator
VRCAADIPRRLLIVDDDASLRQMLTWCFEDRGYRVWTAASSGEALALAPEVEPAYALLDYHLPDGTGHRLSKALWQSIPRLVSVLMSGDRSAALADLDEPLLARAFVQKPIRLAQIDSLFTGNDRAGLPVLATGH